jgi:hypothetical protein
MNTATLRLASPAKLWRSYLSALEARPIRTKVLTSVTLFVAGDIFAQLAIEKKQLGLEDRIRDAGVIKDVRNLYDVCRKQSLLGRVTERVAGTNNTYGPV